MIRTRLPCCCVLVLVAFSGIASVPAAARAQAHGPVLFHCDDEVFGAGAGGCATMLQALQDEMADFGLEVLESIEPLPAAPHPEPVPAIVVSETRELGAIFAIWFSRSESFHLTVHVYDPGNEQKLAKMAIPAAAGPIEYKDVAFRIRSLMGASLYSDLEDIVGDEVLMDLAVPVERKEVIAKVEPASPPRIWVVLNQGYLLMGYPARSRGWYHGVAFDAAVVPVAGLEIFVDGAAAFPHDAYTADDPAGLSIDNRQFLVGLGVRYDVLPMPVVALLPVLGFHLGFSETTVSLGGSRHFLKLNPALWAGIEFRAYIVRRVAFTVGLRFENLFHYEQFYWEGRRLFGMHQFRFGAMAGVSVGI